jgi:non-ribosomal peptide synthetase component F
VPVGAPIWETTFHLVLEKEEIKGGVEMSPEEKYSEVLGEGEGELWIGGLGVARGYLHAPHLTAARFLPNYFTKQGNCYRTGDLFRRTAEGEYIFVRRLDDQVKVAGFRIELGEVEIACSKHPLVEQVVALVKSDRLVVFVKFVPEAREQDEQLFLDPLYL